MPVSPVARGEDPERDRRPLLSVVAALLDEAEVVDLFHASLARTLAALPEVRHEIVLVDDGSTDATLERINALAARDPTVVPLSLSRNFGQPAALSAGLDAARGDAVVLMDADLQHPPELIPAMVAAWTAGADVVSALRRRTADASALKRWSSAGFYFALNRVARTRVTPGAADFCLLSRRVCDALRAMPERRRFLRGLIAWVGFQRVFVPYDAPPRAAGRTKYGPRRMLDLALDGIFALSVAPMRAAVGVGCAAALLGLLGAAYAGGRALLERPVPGWAPLACVALALGGCQIAAAGVLGEYLARLLEAAQERPLYLLKQGRREPPA